MSTGSREREATGGWAAEVFTADDGSEPYTTFAEGLDDFTWVALDAAITHVLAVRGVELVRTEWLKPLGEGLHEFRVRHDASEITNMFGSEGANDPANLISPPRAILLRVFVHFHGDRVVLLLSGYDKGSDPSDKRQQREIARARKCLTAWHEQQKRQRKAERRQPGAGRAAHS